MNAIARLAYRDGCDYFIRVTDDAFFNSVGWASIGINRLLKFKPPNMGVVGPTFDYGNFAILAFDMTHRTHYNLFQYYYPPEFVSCAILH